MRSYIPVTEKPRLIWMPESQLWGCHGIKPRKWFWQTPLIVSAYGSDPLVSWSKWKLLQ